MAPKIYTPVVAEACRHWSHIFRRFALCTFFLFLRLLFVDIYDGLMIYMLVVAVASSNPDVVVVVVVVIK
jgi:hypothetical protein